MGNKISTHTQLEDEIDGMNTSAKGVSEEIDSWTRVGLGPGLELDR